MHLLLQHVLLVILVAGLTEADIFIYNESENLTITAIPDLPAMFGPSLPSMGLEALAVKSIPHDGCTKPVAPPKINGYLGTFILVVHRYNCSFVDKVLNAQAAGYAAVIVRNIGSNSLEVMSGDKHVEFVRIPAVFIGEDDGLMIENNFLFDSGYVLILDDNLPFDIKDYLLPFAITIGICFVLLLSFMVIKCFRDYKLSRRHRLSPRSLKKLPIHKFKKGDPYECCAVCLDDYVDNDKLRVLPCAHAYHQKCIDPWLTNNRRVCPICKRKVITGDEKPSDFESDSEDEFAPLVNAPAGTQGGTFATQRENPFTVAQRQQTRRQPRYNRLEEDSSDDSSDDEAHLYGAASNESQDGTKLYQSINSKDEQIVLQKEPQHANGLAQYLANARYCTSGTKMVTNELIKTEKDLGVTMTESLKAKDQVAIVVRKAR